MAGRAGPARSLLLQHLVLLRLVLLVLGMVVLGVAQLVLGLGFGAQQASNGITRSHSLSAMLRRDTGCCRARAAGPVLGRLAGQVHQCWGSGSAQLCSSHWQQRPPGRRQRLGSAWALRQQASLLPVPLAAPTLPALARRPLLQRAAALATQPQVKTTSTATAAAAALMSV